MIIALSWRTHTLAFHSHVKLKSLTRASSHECCCNRVAKIRGLFLQPSIFSFTHFSFLQLSDFVCFCFVQSFCSHSLLHTHTRTHIYTVAVIPQGSGSHVRGFYWSLVVWWDQGDISSYDLNVKHSACRSVCVCVCVGVHGCVCMCFPL